MRFHSYIHFGIFFVVGLMLTACEIIEKKETIEKKPPVITEPVKVEKKPEKPDYSKLTLEEIHNLPTNRECRKLLEWANEELRKRPVVNVIVKTVKGLSEKLDLDNVFYLKPMAEKYPLDSSIRSYHCPKHIEDVKVIYKLNKGDGFSSLYHFTYFGDLQGINVSNPFNPEGLIESRFGDGPPLLTLHIDKIEIASISPSQIFSNEDMDFQLENLVFGVENRVDFNFFNKSQENLAIRKFRLTIGKRDIAVDFKNNTIRLKPGKTISKSGIKAGKSRNKWFVNDSNKLVIVVARVVYQAGWKFKKLQIEKYLRLGDLGINQSIINRNNK